MPNTKRYLHDFEVGETFTGFFVIRSMELRSRRDGVPYLVLEFGDRSGRMKGNIWDDVQRIYQELEEDGIVKLQGMIETYQGTRQIVIKRIRKVKPDDSVDTADFLPVSEIDPDIALKKLNRTVKGMTNQYLQALLTDFLDDLEFQTGFTRAPGGKLWHHNRIGGLIEHTLGVLRICRMLARFYPDVDSDLLISGAILHDIGKIEEYRYETSIDYTSRGRLIGHIVLGAEWAVERAKHIEDFPDDLLDQLTHLILSHQGEFGSPIQPSTREAFLLHYADQIDSKMDALRRIKKGLQEGERWKFVKLLERFIDLGEEDNN